MIIFVGEWNRLTRNAHAIYMMVRALALYGIGIHKCFFVWKIFVLMNKYKSFDSDSDLMMMAID